MLLQCHSFRYAPMAAISLYRHARCWRQAFPRGNISHTPLLALCHIAGLLLSLHDEYPVHGFSSLASMAKLQVHMYELAHYQRNAADYVLHFLMARCCGLVTQAISPARDYALIFSSLYRRAANRCRIVSVACQAGSPADSSRDIARDEMAMMPSLSPRRFLRWRSMDMASRPRFERFR